MAKAGGSISIFYTLLMATVIVNCYGNGNERKIHIVYMGDKHNGDSSVASTHHSMLQSVLGSSLSAEKSLVYSYGRSFNGFAAKLSDEEVRKFSEMEGVVSVIPNHIFKLHTTRSWEFMGLTQVEVGKPEQGNVIIGFMDTGIWPESDSFNDAGLSPPPAKWNGTCKAANFTCNNKIIGARFYNSDNVYEKTDFKSPRDSLGHGTHTSSTAAGAEVVGASYFGLANGTAKGGVTGSRIAVYKVCWSFGCSSADILAAFDDAIADGVDIISASIGSDYVLEYMEDPTAIGSFHAMKHGILTSNSAGNSGPYLATVSNYAPWTMTVAASTIDRKFVSQVVLGNGKAFTGISINNFQLNGTSFPLIWGGDAANYSTYADPSISKFCLPGAMNSYKLQGRIVFCEALTDGSGVLMANGLGTIMADSPTPDPAYSFPLPASVISVEDGQAILDYIRSTDNPIATILAGETLRDTMAPYVASFSSRGPNPISPDILKPDLTAPGVDIIAAWSPVAPPSIYDYDTRSVKFNVISGTSMSCPHASGAASYVKAAHPDWSPAAIKSALMTTAYVIDPRKHEDLEFAYGSGHINPLKVTNPGLVYDAHETDYINFLCKQGYNTTTLRIITGNNKSCSSQKPGKAWDLNYPSFSLAIEDGEVIYGVFKRTVTNVGSPSIYKATSYMPHAIRVTVEPPVLSFSSIGEKKSFTVKVYGQKITQQPIMSGAILWKDGVHVVRSPLVVYNILPGKTYHSLSMQQLKTTIKGSFVHNQNGILGRNKI